MYLPKISQPLPKLSDFENCYKEITSILKFQPLPLIFEYFAYILRFFQNYLSHIKIWILLFHNCVVSWSYPEYFQSYDPSKFIAQNYWQCHKLYLCTFSDISGISSHIIELVLVILAASYYSFAIKLLYEDIPKTSKVIDLQKL